MTHRDGQSMRRRTKSTHIADSARLIDRAGGAGGCAQIFRFWA